MGHADVAIAEARGFMKSRVILTAAELNFFTRLDEKPCSAGELAGEKGLDARAVTRVLDCLVTFGLLEKQDGIYKPTENGAFYSSLNPQTVLPMILHMNRLWDTWSNLTEVVKKGGHSELEPGLHMDDRSWKSFIGAMHVAGRELAHKIAYDYDLGPFKRLLDIGGASGTYTIAFLLRNPAMTAVLFDLENVIPMAREKLLREGIENRVDFVAGNFYEDEFPKGCDLALLSAIIHQNSQERNLDLYTKIFSALEPGGTLLIRDHIMDESRTNPAAGAMFAINMLVNTRGGDTYTFNEVKEGLERAGFTNVRQVLYGEGMDCLVSGQKPA
ncbi:MAG TPA: methyltransferase [Dissulfurispiraceae bacterium]|nr:methyltransferase [Dissulfurispiraceae bacterium]